MAIASYCSEPLIILLFAKSNIWKIVFQKTEIMAHKIIRGIIHIKSVSKKKVMIDRIRAHLLRIDYDNNDDCSIEKLESMLSDLIDQNII